VLAFVDTPRPSDPRRRAVRGPLIALAGAIALYIALWVIPWHLHPSTGRGALHVYRVGDEARLEPLADGGPLTAGSKVALEVSSQREASVVVLALRPRRVLLVAPTTPATGAIERIHPGAVALLPDRPAIDGPAGPVRFLAVFCNSALPPETVLKAGQRALAAGQGDPDAVHTLDLGCAEAYSGVRVVERMPDRPRPP